MIAWPTPLYPSVKFAKCRQNVVNVVNVVNVINVVKNVVNVVKNVDIFAGRPHEIPSDSTLGFPHPRSTVVFEVTVLPSYVSLVLLR